MALGSRVAAGKKGEPLAGQRGGGFLSVHLDLTFFDSESAHMLYCSA